MSRIGTKAIDKMFNCIFYQSNDHFIFICKIPIEGAFTKIGLFGNIFNRCRFDALFTENVQSRFLELSAGIGSPFLPTGFAGFFSFFFNKMTI